MTAKKIIILGAGGNSINIIDAISDINFSLGHIFYDCVGILDDDPNKWQHKIREIEILGPMSAAKNYSDCWFIYGIGSSTNYFRRKEILDKLGLQKHQFITIIHPSASVSRMSNIGVGCVILQNVTISNDVRLGNHVIIHPNTTINHGDDIGDFTTIAPAVCICGEVIIGEESYLGANSTLINNISIGKRCLVGIGSVVFRSISDNTVVIGNPARKIR